MNYIDPELQINKNNYYYKDYHNSYDHGGEKAWENSYHHPDLSKWIKNNDNHAHHSHGHH